MNLYMRGTIAREAVYGDNNAIESDAIDMALELATFASEYGLLALRTEFGDARFGAIYASRYIEDQFAALDTASGLYIKSYGYPREAELQFATMNLLHTRLAAKDIGVAAVQHLALVRSPYRSVAVVQAAVGESVRRRYKNQVERSRVVGDIERRIDIAIGRCARKLLVNDTRRGDNEGGNIIQDEDGLFHLIDQPYVGSNRGHFLKRAALQLLGAE